MIDPNLPLEFDDGTPVKHVYPVYPGASTIDVSVPYSLRSKKDSPNSYSYYLDTGNWCGDDGTKRFRIRNVDDAASYIPEDWS